MAEEGSSPGPSGLPALVEEPGTSVHSDVQILTPTAILKNLIEDETYKLLQRHFLMQGKGRRPDLPRVDGVTNKLLLQLFFLKEEAQTTYRELTSWLHKLVASTQTVSESKIYHRINDILESCKNRSGEETTTLLTERVDFSTQPLPESLISLGLNNQNISYPETYDEVPKDDVTNDVVVSLSLIMNRENKSPIFMRKWLSRLSLACASLTDKKLRNSISNAIKIYKQLSKCKKVKELNEFLKAPFINKDHANQTSNQGVERDNVLKDKEKIIKNLETDIVVLRSSQKKLDSELTVKYEIIKELQEEKRELASEIESMRAAVAKVSKLEKQVKALEESLEEVSDTKLYYKRNAELKTVNDDLKRQISVLEAQFQQDQATHAELKKKIKAEQDMKSKYKKKLDACKEENMSYLHALHAQKSEEEVPLTQLVDKCTMYSDKIRQLFMILQGEANVAATHVSKVVMLVAKHLFDKDIPLSELPCPRTCLNFMDEAHHIAKQQIVKDIRESKHFTYGTDGTSREKRHFMEHHLVMDNGATLSIGFSEVADDKASTLLEKSLDLFDELSDVYCQANEKADRNEVFKEILTKMLSLMSDRAANMKLFNKKMLEYKKDVLGEDASIQFLYCNAHFLIGLAEELQKAIKTLEGKIEEDSGSKLGRGGEAVFKNWGSDETSSSRLLRTAADVFGPRGDERSGCREEWLAHCELAQVKSQFTSYRSNRFNNTFENAIALLYHYEECLHFLSDRVSHSNKKLLSISYDLKDVRVMSFITAIALFSTYLTTPYWTLMNSTTPYGKFPKYVQSMKVALERWSSDDFDIKFLPHEEPIFGLQFKHHSSVADLFLKTKSCDESLTASAFKTISNNFKDVMNRQLFDFLQGGVYGSSLTEDIQNLLDTCPLTNLTGERLFGDLDYDMTKRRTASTYLRSTINMWKHNRPSQYLNQQTPKSLKKTMSSGRKHGKELKRKHKAGFEKRSKKGLLRMKGKRRRKIFRAKRSRQLC